MVRKHVCRAVAIVAVAVLGVAAPVTSQEVCTTEEFPNIVTDQYLGVVGGLNFGQGNFAGFVQSDWFNNFGFNLYPDCADGVVWMPAAGQIASTTEPLTREITFEEGCCVLTSITVTAHQSENGGGEGQTGTLTIRALDSNGQQIGDAIVRELNYDDGCVTIETGWDECHARIEITYSRGSELGIVDMSYCCGEDEVGDEGCTPGYWKQPQHFGNWEGYTQNQDFDTVFGVNLFNPNITLLQALNLNGGGVNRLARHATAGLLSASSSGVLYPYTVAEVLALAQAGDADSLEDANELGCPLARDDDGSGESGGGGGKNK